MDYPESLQDYALDEIRRRIQTGVYPVSSKLAPQKIAADLNISSTPVVAALNRLVSQGLVERIPRRGFIVKQFSTQDIRNYFDTRIMMECWAVNTAIQNVDKFPDLIAQLQEIVDQFDNISPTDLTTARDLETRFHLLLIQMAGNDQLTRLYEFNWSVGSVFFVYSVGRVTPEDFQISLRRTPQDPQRSASAGRKHACCPYPQGGNSGSSAVFEQGHRLVHSEVPYGAAESKKQSDHKKNRRKSNGPFWQFESIQII